jgi:predicted AAA+ superfamily ATPase
LNSLFTVLAFNTANEVSLQDLAQKSGVTKNTIKRYIEYLEAAFLIKIVHRVDQNARRFRRANFFKIYLTNPSMRAALFSPVLENDTVELGHLAETAIFSQWFHSDETLHYARWDKGTDKGEVDIVWLSRTVQKPDWAVEVKWSDRYCDKAGELGSLLGFCRRNNLPGAIVTSKTRTQLLDEQGIHLEFLPTSLYCYTVGFNLVHGKDVSHIG